MSDLDRADPAERAHRVLAETDSGREAVRAFFHGVGRGAPYSLAEPGGGFLTPMCGDWECISPEHQSWVTCRPRGSCGHAAVQPSGRKANA
jgi:hypothetical protein